MRITRKITDAQIRRVKWMTGFATLGLVSNFITNKIAANAFDYQNYEGPYLWGGEEYDKFIRVKNPGGYIDEYTNKETFCTSWIYHPGLSLLGDGALGVCYLLFLFWLFIGISILADIFMEAIEVITSKSELVQVTDADGEIISIEKMFWNPTIANLTLMALGSSAPEIILSIADTMGTLGKIPSELGPQAIVGSASFNLLVISAVSILAVNNEIKKINMVGVFITTAIMSTWAYIWFFLVLVIISPGVVELWEAAVTLGFMVALVIIAYSCDVCHTKGEDLEERRAAEKRQVTKAAIRILAKKFGVKAVLQVGQGDEPQISKKQNMTIHDKENILNFYEILLEKPASEATIDELLDCLNPENSIERIAYRKEVAKGTTHKPEFLRLKAGEKGEAAINKIDTGKGSKTVCFKHLRYEVAETNGFVTITIEKKIHSAFTFWLRTVDGTAKAGEDYMAKNECFTMKEGEKERVYKIEILNDAQWEPDEEFKVQLWSEGTADQESRRLPGDDTECTVTILDEDRPGQIGFADRELTVQRRDKSVFVPIKRINGADGTISCCISTINNSDILPGKKAATEQVDYIPLKMKKITFNANEVEQVLEIEMPECEGDSENMDPADADTVSFALQLSEPMPAGTTLSKKSLLFISIEATDEAAEAAANAERRKMLEFFLSEKNVTWAQQFKIACMLGPSIDQDSLVVEEVSGSAAFMHLLSMFWKVFGALVPPRHHWGGWAAFIVALILIGIVTTIVGEVATVLGCVVSLKPSVTGITLVAMGTSLPDTFASMTAARTSQYADSAIGNVTGSNSVNVFLGMGLPWLIATIWWRTKHDSDYFVPPGSMSFSVIVFLAVSMACFLILGLRRCCLGGELGGQGCARPLSAGILFVLWLIYVIFVSLESYGVIVVEIGDVPPPPEL